MTREVPLTRGFVSLVDDDDAPLVTDYRWHVLVQGRVRYAIAYARKGRGHPRLRMHRLITAAPPGVDVDHINGDGLDNRRANLRFASRGQNLANVSDWRFPGKSSQFKGVSLFRRDNIWVAHIKVGGRSKHLGRFQSEEQAARAYNQAALEHFGEFARLNIIGEVS